jgi:hypothetical protein
MKREGDPYYLHINIKKRVHKYKPDQETKKETKKIKRITQKLLAMKTLLV